MPDDQVTKIDAALLTQIAIAAVAAGTCSSMEEALWWAVKAAPRFVVPTSPLERSNDDALTRGLGGLLGVPVPRPAVEVVTVLDLEKGELRIEHRHHR